MSFGSIKYVIWWGLTREEEFHRWASVFSNSENYQAISIMGF